MTLPRISVVTPSYNQAEFLEEAMLSVFGQEYPNLEYIVMDGGSTDGSVDVIQRYADRIDFWQSQSDGGQAAAINAAFDRATGDIFAWLNSDDWYLPGVLSKVAKVFQDSDVDLCYGRGLCYDNNGKWCGIYGDLHNWTRFTYLDYIIQPAAFWRRSLWEATGPLDTTLNFSFDWEWFIRATHHANVTFIPELLAAFRDQGTNKTTVGGDVRQDELFEVNRRHASVEHQELYRSVASRVVPRWHRVKRITHPRLRAWYLRWLLGKPLSKIPPHLVEDMAFMLGAV